MYSCEPRFQLGDALQCWPRSEWLADAADIGQFRAGGRDIVTGRVELSQREQAACALERCGAGIGEGSGCCEVGARLVVSAGTHEEFSDVALGSEDPQRHLER